MVHRTRLKKSDNSAEGTGVKALAKKGGEMVG
uniref:Uncharacterized protein n=1 Tax=Anguilla anguilla TaxID=7936 RepID=A0A0E9R5R7_ANGAN